MSDERGPKDQNHMLSEMDLHKNLKSPKEHSSRLEKR